MGPKVAPGLPKKIQLASKEQTLFKELLQLYESRQLKKAQKTADQILKKYPEHGETISMKGLVLTHMGKKDEGLELVRKGVRLDLTSHICWHVFGLVHKIDKNYEEALKCYVQALKFDKENMNILRDAAQLQTQLRYFEPLQDTRLLILKLRPNLRQNWIALAVAYHLGGNLRQTRSVLEAYLKTVKNVPDYDYEHSELLMYHVRVLEDLEEYLEALSVLDTNSKSRSIVDRTSILLLRARLLSRLGRKDEAEAGWRILIDQNSDCYDYYRGFLLNKGIDLDTVGDGDRAEALHILQNFSDHLPLATAPLRLSLDIATGNQFHRLVTAYLINRLSRGIPSLFADIKALYSDGKKRLIVENVVEGFLKRLQDGEGLDGEEPESPTTYLWTLYFLSLHYSFCGAYPKALSLIDTALAHTPTLPELYMAKARTLKRAGDPYGASQWMESARRLDGQDRFLNTKSAKYLMRAGDLEEANRLLGMFTKKDAASPGSDLEDMQSLSYLIQQGDALLRAGKLGPALRKYHSVEKIFTDIEDDQYDFHTYSLRRFTINIYLATITFEDHLRSHPTYVTAALSASRIYIRTHDDPGIITTSASLSGMSDTEKKARKKARKAKTQEEAKRTAMAGIDDSKGDILSSVRDEDPDGMKLLSTPTPLEQAVKLLRPLETLVPDRMDMWIVVYDVAVRRRKYLQALKALKTCCMLNPEDPDLHVRTIDFHLTISALVLEGHVGDILSSSLVELVPPTHTLMDFNTTYSKRHSTSGGALLAVATSARRLLAGNDAIEKIVFDILGPEVSDLRITTALDAVGLLRELQSSRTSEFLSACQKRFPLSTVFKDPTELAALKIENEVEDVGQEEHER